MNRGAVFIIAGIVLMLAGPVAGWVISKTQLSPFQDPPSPIPRDGLQVLAEHRRIAFYAIVGGHLIGLLGLGLLTAGLVPRGRAASQQEKEGT